MRVAVRVFLFATLLLLVMAFLQVPVWWGIALPIFLMMSTQGFIMPNATVGALLLCATRPMRAARRR